MTARGTNDPTSSSRDARHELREDRAFEKRVLWKGLVALLVVLVVIWLRQTYWI